MKLINIHLNSIYSFLQSTIQLDNLIENALKNNVEYLAITERGNFFSFAPFYEKCQAHKLKSIFGLDVDIEIQGKPYRFILHAKNNTGLFELFNLSYDILSNKKLYLDDVANNKNIIFIEHVLDGYYKKTKQVLDYDNHYISLGLHEVSENAVFINENLHKILISHHNAIMDFDDNSLIKILALMNEDAINSNATFDILEFGFAVATDLEKKLITKTNELMQGCYFELPKNDYILPKFQNELNLDSTKYLQTLIKNNIVKRFEKSAWNDEYKLRLLHEMSIIEKLKFEDYFLIIQDWVNWAKKNKIAIGPGRGSAAGSLVSYILGITNVDPLKYGLIFERFLNPERVSMPDIDIDVQDNRRQEVIEYLNKKYGSSQVANIVTFASLGKKSAIRDVMRTYDVSPAMINEVSKLIGLKEGSLLEEYQSNKKFALALNSLNKEDANFSTKILNYASQLEGFYRQTGTHAAGVIIAPKPINQIIPTYKIEDGIQQTQVSMEYLEHFGLLKMDILGLKTLTTIQEVLLQIKKTKNLDLDLAKIKYEDQLTFDLLNTGSTVGIFQLESFGMTKALKQIHVDSFNDIVATISLYRPGPMDNLKVYAKRKNAHEPIPSISKAYDEIVKGTYGIIIYQEQIMQIVQAVANLSFSQADNIRRIISKKKVDEMHAVKTNFVNSAIKNGYSEKDALNIFELISKFADYGFNKSHAVSYAMISYQMAYLKAHYPLEFYSAIISSAHGAHETIARFSAEAKSLGIEIISPDINLSNQNATILNKAIVLPLNMIKGIGPETVRLILEDRKINGPYRNFLHLFVCLMHIKNFGLANLEILIKANALRTFNINQATMLNEIAKENSDIRLLFKIKKTDNSSPKDFLEEINNYSPSEHFKVNPKEEAQNEAYYLGQVYNFNLVKKYELEGNRLANIHLGTEHIIYVYCSDVKRKISTNDKEYYVVVLEDSSMQLILRIFRGNDSYLEMKNHILKVKIIRQANGNFILRNWSIINDHEE
ncbi:DNA polymerase III subunit alpha [Metamycoplasma arthritidis]|uniref:DNA-directed DNA polymerase n=1 Tax=Metamycoplasma arthritidis (strain 158L3-1) TaxID=243272 RepID=B3PMZ7_META1|nr:DNA polymerase III subunit alpha [Metamycoplasma arthritidis]ACF07399.1 DNA polymerase III subunit alpha [Metamycoplasma arthritidis 158L3-1]